MNPTPNKHKRISFNTTAMASLGFTAPPKILGLPLNLAHPPRNVFFFAQVPPSQLFWSEIFRPPPKIRGAATMATPYFSNTIFITSPVLSKSFLQTSL